MKFWQKVLDIVYPTDLKCIFCDEELDGTTLHCTCLNCYQTLPFIRNYCKRCGLSLPEGNNICLRCKTINYDFDIARAVFDYTDKVVNIMHQIKYSGQSYLTKPLAGFLVDMFATTDIVADYVCSVPLHADRLKERGFNQSELIAKEFSAKLNIPYKELCIKVKKNASQTSLDFKNRAENVKDVYSINQNYRKLIKDKSIIVIDDTFTTGATCNEIAKVLKHAGASKVYVLTIAHTLLPQKI